MRALIFFFLLWSGAAMAQTTCSGNSAALIHVQMPQTVNHYAANGNFVGGSYALVPLGYNLADVSSAADVDSLPTGVKGLVYLGLTNGVDSAFLAVMAPFQTGSHPKLYGFYLADEPSLTTAMITNLKAESDWIHANLPGPPLTYLVLENQGTPNAPSYTPPINPANSGIDLYGIDPYPIRAQFTGGADYTVINSAVTAAVASGIPTGKLIPTYQAFGGGGFPSWTLPTAAQAQQLLITWGSVLPAPAFDYVYSYGVQSSDTALSNGPSDLLAVFVAHNQPPPP
jgi:hypothetical protein